MNLIIKIAIPLVLCALIAVNFVIQCIFPFYNLGIQPRTLHGMIGILTSPFFHADRYHLIGNLSIFWLLGILFYLKQEIWKSNVILLSITLLQGIIVWSVGRYSNHIGLSGVILGIFGYMLANFVLCWEWKNIWKLLVSGLGIYLYAGLFPQIFNFQSGVSFEGHIAGFISGIIVAKVVLFGERKS